MSPSTTKRVLIVDDQENWRKALTRLLESNFEVTATADVKQALLALRESNFAVAILDIRLIDRYVFDVGGLELLETIKTNMKQTRVIILTGYPESLPQAVWESISPDEILLKFKFDPGDFQKTVKRLVLLT